MLVPKVFISYSHDSLDHKKWCLELAIRLRNNGIDAIIDQFELKAGDDVPHFMETNLSNANKILMICTERYVDKADKGSGGVGYEKMIITSNLLEKINESKVIPIIRQNGEIKVPTFLKTKLYINFSKDDDYEYSYDDLVRTIHNSPVFEKPPVGNNPFKAVKKEELDGDSKLLDETLSMIINLQGVDPSVNSTRVANNLNISTAMFRVLATKLIKLDYVKWSSDTRWVRATDKGFLYAHNKNLIK
ncbi:toll/interleukin-1 receptor domain-containing protein [Allomuricauda sp. CP2A]|jgi:predicted transcriptional regulator|uniref:toll/interleukin-1 receptor domain-containing protein n=1 Tax=Allomuricauda sp. CP2A TaxID=1848189 RepID=UPI00083561FE|nr:toll/interleukin-1 receptor domain-containing protein [Muricauda sp. CP2A]